LEEIKGVKDQFQKGAVVHISGGLGKVLIEVSICFLKFRVNVDLDQSRFGGIGSHRRQIALSR